MNEQMKGTNYKIKQPRNANVVILDKAEGRSRGSSTKSYLKLDPRPSVEDDNILTPKFSQAFTYILKRKGYMLAFCVLGSALAACSVEGKNDYGSYYQKQASLGTLKMPPGVTEQGADNYYVVPPGPMADVKTVSILPPGSRAYQSAMAKQNGKAAATPTVPPVSDSTPNTTAGNS